MVYFVSIRKQKSVASSGNFLQCAAVSFYEIIMNKAGLFTFWQIALYFQNRSPCSQSQYVITWLLNLSNKLRLYYEHLFQVQGQSNVLIFDFVFKIRNCWFISREYVDFLKSGTDSPSPLIFELFRGNVWCWKIKFYSWLR